MTQEEKEQRVLNEISTLKKNTAYSLPDNPSERGWSAKQIKDKMYRGIFILYDWFKENREDVEKVLDTMGNTNVYYYDTLPNESKLKQGDLYFDENDN